MSPNYLLFVQTQISMYPETRFQNLILSNTRDLIFSLIVVEFD